MASNLNEKEVSIKLKCLELASLEKSNLSTDATLKAAEKYYDFITKPMKQKKEEI